jgi:hypothetical protein
MHTPHIHQDKATAPLTKILISWISSQQTADINIITKTG